MSHTRDTDTQPVTELLVQWHRGDEPALARLTGLLHDDLRRLAQAIDWRDRSHFFALASRLMRGILVDHARTRLPNCHTREDVSAIDVALRRLEVIDPRQARIVEMRYFGGLTLEQTADAMGIADATVKREWIHARAWLRCELGKHP